MKFTDGQWLNKKNHTMLHPVQVFDTDFKDGVLSVYAMIKAKTEGAEGRAESVDQPAITIRYSSPFENVIKAKIVHFDGEVDLGPHFPLNSDQDFKPEVIETKDRIVFRSGDTEVRINLKEFEAEYYFKDKKITSSAPKSAAYITNDKEENFVREQLTLSVGECVYGLGERYTSFIKNGQVVDMWNEDGGTASELTYKNVPLYVTNENYGVFVNHPEKVSFEVASEHVERVQFSVPGENLEYFIIGGEDMKDVLANYTKLTGKPSLPPAWSFGLWLSTSFTTNYDEDTVTSFIDGMEERDIPLHVFHFDCFWMKEFQWCDFEWDKRVFPDPAGMLKRLKDKGLKICVWINPYIAQKSKLFDEGKEKGYLVKKPNGGVWQWNKWQAGMGLVDFTNPEACKWYTSKLKELLDMGVDSFKTDFGERIPTDVVYHDESDTMKMHNFYTYLFNETVFDLLEEEKGKDEAVLFARSATAGSQKFPVHWGGDCWATYESMAESLRGGLSLCMSGFGFWSHDIGGFENTATPDIYKRWVAFGLLSTHSRLHGSTSYRVPWLFDEESVDVLRHFTKLKCSLMPYLYNQACKTVKTGHPMMRSMIMEFGDDPACKYLDLQYMLGDSLLVAPIFSEQGDVTYYLPHGKWINFITGEEVVGGRYLEETHDYMGIPLMARPNSLIAVGENEEEVDYDFAHGVRLHLVNLEEGCTVTETVRDAKGNVDLTVSVRRENQELFVEAQGNGKPWSIIIRNRYEIKEVNGASKEKTDQGIEIIPEDFKTSSFTIK